MLLIHTLVFHVKYGARKMLLTKCVTLLLISLSGASACRGHEEIAMAETRAYSIPVIVLLKGDSHDGPAKQPLQELARVTQSDFNALWKDIGIDVDFWSPDVRRQPREFPYPRLYAIQNYIVYEHECHFDEIPDLLVEASEVQNMLQSTAAKRALQTLVTIASRMELEGHGIVFRPGLLKPKGDESASENASRA
jgi:hypothetical protein